MIKHIYNYDLTSYDKVNQFPQDKDLLQEKENRNTEDKNEKLTLRYLAVISLYRGIEKLPPPIEKNTLFPQPYYPMNSYKYQVIKSTVGNNFKI
ncbi:hypothetical protein C1H46_001263 [Malus baccata]|uniref:Uncharacterized protein n=1 Tax=Malus baccata TaxID=106549 RepID=A0A540NQ89_MALBA|nr:hypothetical protein C1H46_001263 [Malus baccata]